MERIYLSLGSNLGDRERMLEEAIRLLHAEDLVILRVSSVYESEPLDYEHQPWFLNLVLEADTTLLPVQLMSRLQGVEQRLGRERLVAKGPRTIDIDVLFYGNAVIHSEELQVPHPRLGLRRFVLEPMAELVPEFTHPVRRVPMRELLSGVKGQNLHKVGFCPRLPA